MKLKIFSSLLVVALAAALVGGATMAWFTSGAASQPAKFSTGTLAISLKGDDDQTIDFGDITNLAPGDVTDSTKIVITNDGTLPLAMWGRWECSGSESLAKQLEVIEYTVTDWSTDGPLYMPEHEHWTTFRWDYDDDGHVSLWDLCTKQKPYGNSWFGLALKPGETYELDISFLLRTDTKNSAQGKSTNLKLRVLATQPNTEAVDALFEDIDDGPTSFYPYESQLGH